MRTLHCKVAGTTYEGRQDILAAMNGNESIRLIPEPENIYDNNAIAVYAALSQENGGVKKVGYIPREIAKDIAPLMEGESFDCAIEAVTGGFEYDNGEIANYGLRLQVQLPDYPVGNITL